MRIFAPPGYVRLLDARDELVGRMYEGVPESEGLEALRHEGLRVIDRARCKVAASELRRAIRDGSLYIYAHRSSRDLPSRLDREIYEVAFTFEPSNKDRLSKERVDRVTGAHVLTLAYIDRLPGAPFGLTWPALEELMRADLYFEEAEFRDWLLGEKQKGTWPCHVHRAHTGTLDDSQSGARARGRSPEDDIRLKSRIQSVLAAARTRWRSPRSHPSVREMAKTIAADRGRELDLSEESIRQILSGTYPPMKKRKIGGLYG